MIFRKIADTERFTLNFKELELANRIVTDIFDNAARNPYRAKDGKFTTGPSGKSEYLHNNQWPDYSIEAPKGYTILYTNTKKEHIEPILKEGLKIGTKKVGYGASPEEGNVIWTDTRSPDSMAYGGNTVAFKVPTAEANANRVNDTQHTIPRDIAPKDIVFVDRVLHSNMGIKVSRLPEYVDKYGKERTAEVIARTGSGVTEAQVLELIDTYESRFKGKVNNGRGYNPNRDKDGKFTFGPSGAINSSPQHITTMSQEEAERRILTALEENDIELQEFDVSQYHMAVSRKVSKELPEDIRIGDNYDPNNPSKYLDSKEYYELSKKRQALYDKYMENINKSIGVNTELGSLYITEHNYNYIKNNGEKFLPSQVNFYKAGNFSLKDGRVKLEITENLQGHKPAYWYGMDEEKTFFDNLITNNKFIKVNEKELKSLLSKRAESDDNIYNLTFPAISRAESRALSEYNLVSAVNQNLRNGKTTKAASYIESAIDKTYNKPQTVYRGLRGEFATKVSNMKPGDTLVDKGFMSTSSQIGSTEIEGARKFGQSGVIMKINTNGGFGTAIDMDPYVSDLRFTGESEVLLNRNTNLEMVGAETRTVKDRDGTSSDITIIEFKEK